MKRILRVLVWGMTSLSVLFSCKPQEDSTIPVESISVNPTSLTLEEGETANISATFTVKENTASDSRTCRLQVHYEAAQSPVWITITQLGKSGIAGPIIETSIGENDYVVLEPTGEENYLFICYVKNPIPGVDLVAKADVDWIKNIKKYNDYYYSFDALPNNTEDTREGHIDLTYSTVHKRLTFIQDPND